MKLKNNKFKKERKYERIQFEKYKEKVMKKAEREKRNIMKNKILMKIIFLNN